MWIPRRVVVKFTMNQSLNVGKLGFWVDSFVLEYFTTETGGWNLRTWENSWYLVVKNHGDGESPFRSGCGTPFKWPKCLIHGGFLTTYKSWDDPPSSCKTPSHPPKKRGDQLYTLSKTKMAGTGKSTSFFLIGDTLDLPPYPVTVTFFHYFYMFSRESL